MSEAQKCELRTQQLCDGFTTWRVGARTRECDCYCALIGIYKLHNATDAAQLALYQKALAVARVHEIRRHCAFVNRYLPREPGPDNGEEAGPGC
jgi:hypothetical protein